MDHRNSEGEGRSFSGLQNKKAKELQANGASPWATREMDLAEQHSDSDSLGVRKPAKPPAALAVIWATQNPSFDSQSNPTLSPHN